MIRNKGLKTGDSGADFRRFQKDSKKLDRFQLTSKKIRDIVLIALKCRFRGVYALFTVVFGQKRQFLSDFLKNIFEKSEKTEQECVNGKKQTSPDYIR